MHNPGNTHELHASYFQLFVSYSYIYLGGELINMQKSCLGKQHLE